MSRLSRILININKRERRIELENTISDREKQIAGIEGLLAAETTSLEKAKAELAELKTPTNKKRKSKVTPEPNETKPLQPLLPF